MNFAKLFIEKVKKDLKQSDAKGERTMFLLGIILIVINLLLAVGIFYAIGQFGDTIEHAQYGYFFVLFLDWMWFICCKV